MEASSSTYARAARLSFQPWMLSSCMTKLHAPFCAIAVVRKLSKALGWVRLGMMRPGGSEKWYWGRTAGKAELTIFAFSAVFLVEVGTFVYFYLDVAASFVHGSALA